ncbi:F0F1 ATP synthase subunit B [Endozoicomonas sp. SCSIO W0465]|uniref:F0F1 ATP synthase subunit B n=1 Tax=Endozoicomonas sp. SCSIO W0465 TaxID=2918516 RepID=UPI0020758F1A|nr:F0F1 ATP synthase subunit B [Endozoicomonas sp. SCSIO W0465]USE36244.1 F0F1 ATP synthase subunit B [Endozoicomonas sp. SCSIO W0465]
MNLNATLIGQSIAFAFFVWFCMKYVWPPLTKALSDRQQKIADGLAAADKAEKDLAQANDKVAELLKEARAEAQGIIESANKRANQIVDDAKQQARAEGNRLKAAAAAEIEQEANRAREALRSQVASLAVAGAERILGEHLDEAANSKLVDDLAAEL